MRVNGVRNSVETLARRVVRLFGRAAEFTLLSGFESILTGSSSFSDDTTGGAGVFSCPESLFCEELRFLDTAFRAFS